MTTVSADRNRLKQLSRRAMKTTSYTIFPMLAGLMMVADPLIKLLLTDKWLFCVPFLQCSCVYYMCQPIQTTNWQIIKAVGRSDLCLKLEAIKKVIGVSIILITMNYGVLAIALGNAAFGVISMIINILPIRKLIGYSAWEQIKDLMPAIVLSGIMCAIVKAVSLIDVGIVCDLILQVVSGGLAYLLLSYILKVDSFMYLLDIARSKIFKGKRST